MAASSSESERLNVVPQRARLKHTIKSMIEHESSGSLLEGNNAMRSALLPLLVVVSLSAVTAMNGPAIADKLDANSIPTGAVYVCAAGSGKDRTIAAIALEEKIAALCRRHTEMGPCQNARNACRRSGGGVYAADGSEVTQADEAEYDKKVMRVRVGP